MVFNSYIDYTNLNLSAKAEDIACLCKKAMENNYESVCVFPCFVKLAKEFLEGSNVMVSTVIFSSTPKSKVYEAIDAIEMGADEIGMVLNVGALKDKDYDYLKEEIEDVRNSIDGKALKIIIPITFLSDEEIVKTVEILGKTFVNFAEFYSKEKEELLRVLTFVNDYKSEILETKVSGNILETDIEDFISKGVSRICINQREDDK